MPQASLRRSLSTIMFSPFLQFSVLLLYCEFFSLAEAFSKCFRVLSAPPKWSFKFAFNVFLMWWLIFERQNVEQRNWPENLILKIHLKRLLLALAVVFYLIYFYKHLVIIMYLYCLSLLFLFVGPLFCCFGRRVCCK